MASLFRKLALNSAMARNVAASRGQFSTSTALRSSHAEHMNGVLFWKGVTFFVCAPLLVLAHIKVFVLDEHTHAEPQPRYDYLRIRTKRMPWGDGDTPLFRHLHPQEHYGIPTHAED